jgi:two-component system cell cycle sensor histidine kinase/response regulator CckA
MADRPKSRSEWLEALQLLHRNRTARPGSPARLDPSNHAGDERLGHALEHVRAVMIEVDANGRSVYVSPSITAVLGYSVEEVTDVVGWDFIHDDDMFRLVEMSEELRTTGQPVSAVLRARHKSGHWLWIETTSTEFRTPEDESWTVTLARDVTAMRDTYEALRASEDRFQGLARNSSDLILELDDTGTIRYASENRMEILGKPAEELIGKSLRSSQNLHPDDVAGLTQGFGELVNAERRSGGRELRLLHADGTWHWFDGRITSYTSREGEWRALVIARDITENRLAQQELRDSEERYRVISETSGELISEVDGEGRLHFSSPGVAQVLGISPDTLLGSRPFVVIHPDDVQRCIDAFVSCLRSGELMRLAPYRVRAGDGSWHWIETDGIQFRRADGEQRFLAVSRDRTEQMREAQERRALERRVEQTQRLEGLGVMAGGIAHDFNNLLTPILGDAGLALMDLPEDSPARTRIQKIQKAARRAAALTNQMLAYAGKGPLIEEPVDLSGLVREMTQLLETSLSRKARLELDLDENLPAVKGDTAQLTQVVMNLLTNASEAVGEEGGRIQIRTGRTPPEALAGVYRIGEELPPGPAVMVEVEDNGCGMNTETRARIFDPFFSTKFTGRGLGLAAALGIVRAHGGAIDIETAPEQGTRFRVLFPAAGELPKRREELPSDIQRWRSDARVLVMDDDEGVRDVAVETLQRAGLRVDCATDAAEGLAIFRDRGDEIALVILDRTLPTHSNESTLARIRQTRPNCRIVLISGYAEERAMANLADNGLAGFLQKPFLPEQLLETVRRALEA